MPGWDWEKFVDSERVITEHLHWADKKGLGTKRKVITQNAELKILESIVPTEEWLKKTPDLENHINGMAPLSPEWKDCEDRDLEPEK